MVKIKRIIEMIESIEDMPDNDTLKKMYGPEGYPLQWQLAWKAEHVDKVKPREILEDDPEKELKRQRQEHITKQGLDKSKQENEYSDRDRRYRVIEDTKIDVVSQISDILGNMLKGDNREFLDELNLLIDKYSEFKTKVDSSKKIVDIDAPFKIQKFDK